MAITDINGNVTDRFEYDTYGNLTSRTGNSDVIFLYNGRDGVVTDSNGLIYMRARYYAPELRRFINADILAGDIAKGITLNRYAYANANTVSLIDPRGLSADERGRSATKEEIQRLESIINCIISASETYSLGELETSVYAGQIRFYCDIDATVGNGSIDISEISKGQIELAQSVDTSVGTFELTASTDTTMSYRYSAEVSENSSVGASISVNVMPGSVSAEYIITTDLGESQSISTTLGMELDSNRKPPTPTPAPAATPNKESIGDKTIDALNDLGKNVSYVANKTADLIGAVAPALVTIVVVAAVILLPVP